MNQVTDTASLQRLVRESIERWHAGARPDAAAVLADHPELEESKSLVMDLVLAEFSLRAASGKPVAKSALCDQFPQHRQSIVRMLEVQEYLDQCPQFAVDNGWGDDGRTRWPAAGDEFLGYEIVEPLGRGGLARVFLAREPDVGGRNVVVKISRFGSREAHTLGKLSHPSIVPILSVQYDHDAGWTAICMPLLGVATAVDLLDAAFSPTGRAPRDGQLVARVARETRPLSPVALPAAASEEFAWRLPYAEAVARLGLQLADALAAAHAVGILHRDIKPSNVLLAWSGRALLLDFNLSTDVAVSSPGVGGTLAYMAPELVQCFLEGQGDAARRFDPRCDVYSLGVVLYELLSGRLPAKPDGADELRPDACEQWLDSKRRPIEPLGRPKDPIDPRLEAMVRRCLACDPAERYATAAELAADLRAYLGPIASLRRRAMRHRRGVLLSLVALVGGIISLASYIGRRPTQLEVLYQRGLDEYEQGRYEAAVATFSLCLQHQAGWPNALFARGQALRKLKRWSDARIDYTALDNVDKKWARALAGYCNMQLNDSSNASTDFRTAHKEGLRDIGFLLNYARSESKRMAYGFATQVYSEVIDLDPTNSVAFRNRGMQYVYSVWNGKEIPNDQAFRDAETDCRLNPDAYEPPLCAAIIYGEAARKDPSFGPKAVEYLTIAMQKGMPLAIVDRFKLHLKPWVGRIPEAIVDKAAQTKEDPPFQLAVPQDPPDMADWTEFQRQVGNRSQLVAKTE